ncbi:hypothetical protein GFL63_20900 [Rhizobium leguminosarum bv. viciae]|uniref:NACHT domain-containing protein n=1 Tax=Rhizobium leguminosarum TaxID=384 RepID=UPI001442193E|nr:NACHT domain-containing protein [Rhizobium leguminosarum]NKK01214.1 hypothetical protein [Rhizobium leguminosarum bv. viciae]
MSAAENVAKATLNAVANFEAMASQFVEPQVVGPGGAAGPAFELLAEVPRAVLFGNSGFGKSTFLEAFAHRTATEFLAGSPGARCPIWMPAKQIGVDGWLVAGLERYKNPFKILLAGPRCILIVDGIDEALEAQRVASQLERLLRRNPNLDALIATRPAAYPAELTELPGYTLQPLDERSIREFIEKIAEGDQKRARRFLDHAFYKRDVVDLMRHPLFLRTLWTDAGGGLWDERQNEDLIADYFQKKLSRSDQRTTATTSRLRGQILGELAAMLRMRQTLSISLDDWLQELAIGYPGLNQSAIVDELIKTEIIVLDGEAVRFSHKLFMIYAIANHFWRHPDRLMKVLAVAEADRLELLRYASWLSTDIGPLVEGCLSRRWLVEAGSCISWSRADNGPLADLVAQRLREAVGEKFFNRLGSTSVEPPENDVYYDLLALMDDACDPTLPGHVRGRKYEDFAAELFSHGFEVHDRNRNTAYGEFDLALEITGGSAFWLSWGGDTVVECKNRSDASDVADINAFASKVDLTGHKLAFFLSTNGFTKPALDLMNRLSLKESKPLMVPLAGDEVRRMLQRRESIEGFFKRAIRKVRDQRL